MSLKLQCIKTHFNAKTQYIVVQESNSFEFGWPQSLFCTNENRGINYPNVQEGSKIKQQSLLPYLFLGELLFKFTLEVISKVHHCLHTNE